MRALLAFDLPCPWVPLQSMTAAASRPTPGRPVSVASCGGKGCHAARVFPSRSRLRRTPEGVWCGSLRPRLRGSGVRPVSAPIGPLMRSRCATGAGAASHGAAEAAAFEASDGVRRRLPRVRSLSAFPARAIVVPVCLSDTVRSQGFSPSQRFDPARASWLCFAPHPPLGFRSSELFPFGQP
jgi:hypothetical protein